MFAVVQTSIIHVAREGVSVPTSARQPQVPQLLQLGAPSEYQGCCRASKLLRMDQSPFLLLTIPPVAARKQCGADSACLQPLPDSARGLDIGNGFLLFMCSKGFNLACE